ncbi:T9SS type A sorting domain-containing protein [Aestuariibaculum lutulentum]|uniref:T9SS type A sorting domain-containing protein n=1 Tax=Aestuariibaculum lutulentum TaxID=2920935 RepID=A0ABS9RM96_9FLAO|nr:T9SS type A sorting domain-containing protein [Aestuariibaculum lutulentum]MCH4554070.1 T9SS type A sorting domain-containing protein [Aestuariibaculum lutulentum]
MKKNTLLCFVTIAFFNLNLYAQPANDNCSGAFPIILDNPAILVTIDNTATGSLTPGDPGCGNYAGSDLWYSVVVPASGGISIITSSSGSSIDDTGLAAYKGVDCDNLTIIKCNDDISGSNTFSQINLAEAEGTTIYIRVWEYDGFTSTGTFNIEVQSLTPPPVATNDECADAIELSLKAICEPVIGSNNATASSGVPGTGCGAYEGGDVWYKIKVPLSGHVIVETTEDDLSIDDGAIAIYSGDCGNLALMNCDDSGNGNNTIYDFGRIELTGLTPDDMLYVRFWAFENEDLGTFKICAIDPEALSIIDFEQPVFKMFPNPVSKNQDVNIQINNVKNPSIDIALYDMQGKLVLTNLGVENSEQIHFSVNRLLSGIYFLKIICDDKILTKKLIVN